MHREHMRLRYVYACRHTNMSSFALSTVAHTPTHKHTHTSDRPYTDVPVITMTMSTHTAA